MTSNTEAVDTLQSAFKGTELSGHCEDFSNAIAYYDGEPNTDRFMEWYKETYIDNAEVIYYHNAIKFLADHDPSLTESMSKAAEFGYKPENINSELLASLLLQDVLSEALEGLRDDLDAYFEAVKP